MALPFYTARYKERLFGESNFQNYIVTSPLDLVIIIFGLL